METNVGNRAQGHGKYGIEDWDSGNGSEGTWDVGIQCADKSNI